MNVLSTSNLCKFYGEHLGIKDVNIDIKKGEVLGFIGPNGSGKSTTIRSILGLLKATSGEVTIFGKNAIENPTEGLAKIGYLPSEVFYYDDMTSLEFLEYSQGFYEDRHPEFTIESLAAEFELDLTKKIKELSFGNKKKVAIIQCFLHNPELLILDEPTSGLDPLMQNKFFDLLDRVNKKGMTIFISSHILSEIERICDRAVIIRSGEIVRVSNISDIVSKTMKMVSLTTPVTINESDFLNGSTKIERKNNTYTFEYNGNYGELLNWLSQQEIEDINIVNQDLSQAIMNYYE